MGWAETFSVSLPMAEELLSAPLSGQELLQPLVEPMALAAEQTCTNDI